MALSDRMTGKASGVSVQGTSIPITKHTATFPRKLADATDSTDYSSTQDMLCETQIPVSYTGTVKVEGMYNNSIIPSGIIALLFAGGGPYAVILTKKSGVTTGHGNFDISNYEESVPVNDMITYSCDLKLNGPFTAGS